MTRHPTRAVVTHLCEEEWLLLHLDQTGRPSFPPLRARIVAI